MEWYLTVPALIVGLGWGAYCYHNGRKYGRIEGYSDGLGAHRRVESLREQRQRDEFVEYMRQQEQKDEDNRNGS